MRGSLSSELPQLLGRVGCSATALNPGSQFGVRNTNHLAPDSADGSPGLLTPVTPATPGFCLPTQDPRKN
jgi:hypothetical protein